MPQTKYYTISEVSDLLAIPQTSLRYLEKIIARFKVRKIRGRRYYTQENIEILRDKIRCNKDITPKQYAFFRNEKHAEKTSNASLLNISNILQRISNLEHKFLTLKDRLS